MRVLSTAGFALTFAALATFSLSRRASALEARAGYLNKNVLAFNEESIPGADLTPTATPTPAAGAASSPGAAGPSNAAAASPSAAGSPASGESPVAAASPAETPAAAPTEVPPAIDIGSIAPSLRVSDQPLNLLIASAPNPARGASLRMCEQARQEINAGHYDDAIRDLGRSISIDPSNSYAYVYLGRAYILKKDYKQALTFLGRAAAGLGADPVWRAEALAFEGLAYEQAGQPTDAFNAYQQALAITPGNLTARVGATRLAAYSQPSSVATPDASDSAAIPGPPVSTPVPEAPPSEPPPTLPDASPSD
jgi:tetratricopeptide (TPR) repeat protein